MNESRLKLAVAASIRELVFGLEDSLVSTLGAVTGIAAGTHRPDLVILSGLVILSVEAVSMAAGSFLSSKSAMEVEKTIGGLRKFFRPSAPSGPVRNAVVMGISYVVGGLIPLVPYFFLPTSLAAVPSVLGTALALFGIGIAIGKFAGHAPLKHGFQMVGISLIAAGIGYGIGRIGSAVVGMEIVR